MTVYVSGPTNKVFLTEKTTQYIVNDTMDFCIKVEGNGGAKLLFDIYDENARIKNGTYGQPSPTVMEIPMLFKQDTIACIQRQILKVSAQLGIGGIKNSRTMTASFYAYFEAPVGDITFEKKAAAKTHAKQDFKLRQNIGMLISFFYLAQHEQLHVRN